MNNYFGRFLLSAFLIALIIIPCGRLISCEISDSVQINIFSPENIKSFADNLFCQKDYLRAIEEYEKYLPKNPNDTVRFKMALSFRMIGYSRKAEDIFIKLSENSLLSNESKFELFKTRFFSGNYSGFRRLYEEFSKFPEKYYNGIKSLYYLSFVLEEANLPDEQTFLNSFPEVSRSEMQHFYQERKDPSYKSPTVAALLSTVIPGAGKIYTKNYGDGITSLVVNGLLTYLAIDNFHSSHNFRGWLFSGLGVMFYAGNIYGSAASAQIYNAGVNYDFSSRFRIYLNNHNYFLTEYESFCK